ncbi:hypothetical protein C8T65DRAFT_211541 [Cerioporus squamosus]|nr:hypothetical protein C8T65DRAFT_211541 [Cerioporus squamosus]
MMSRLDDLVKQTADDIKACANACDVYSKTRLLTKVLRSATWDDLFKQYVELFAQRRADFLLRISVHSGVVLDDAHHKLRRVDEKVDELLRRVSEPSPEQQRLREIVERSGGAEAVASDDVLLEKVLKAEPRAAAAASAGPAGEHDSDAGSDNLATVKAELLESTTDALERNFEVFERKFRLQEMKIVEELTRVAHKEGDRIISSVLDGPHNEIHNPDIRNIWADAGWRGRVKSRHFVSALYDHYRGVLATARYAASSLLSSEAMTVLKLLNLSRLQRVVEAIDVDATGYVTVAAINRFTDSRPESWSLLEWVAYWAIGWEAEMSTYRDKIDVIISKMFSLRRTIRMVDQEVLDIYLAGVHREAETLTRAFRSDPTTVPPGLAKLFRERRSVVEERLRKGMETVRYIIDAPDTLSLIIGPGRIEETILPTLEMLLARDLRIFRLCQTKYVSPEELIASWHSLEIIFEEVIQRYFHLKDVFDHRADPSSQLFRHFACGMFEYWYEPQRLWSLKNMEEDPFPEIRVGEDEEGPLDTAILNFPLATDHLYPPEQESVLVTHALAPSVELILGTWHGFFYDDLDKPCASMYSFDFHHSDPNGLVSFIARGHAAHRGSEFVVTGNIEPGDDSGRPVFSLWLRFVPSHYENYNVYFRGTLHLEGSVFAGTWGMVKHDMPYPFEFRRIPPDLLVCRPPPERFRTSPAAARWFFALTAVHTQVLRKLSSTRLLEQRRRKRRQWEDFVAGEKTVDVSELFRTTTYADACYYFAILLHRNVIHHCICDHCDEVIAGARILCLECGVDDTLDLCDKPECTGAVVVVPKQPAPHLPSHDVVKLRAMVLSREVGRVLKASKAALSRARALLARQEQSLRSSEPAPQAWVIAPGIFRLATHGGPLVSRQSSTTPVPSCAGCSKPVQYPCWFCTDCEVDVFICSSCDANGGVDTVSHRADHGLVRCLRKAQSSGEGASESRMETLERGILSLERRLDALEYRLEQRMSRIEGLLERIAIGQPSIPNTT